MNESQFKLGNWTDSLPAPLRKEVLSKTHFKSLAKGDFLYHQDKPMTFLYEVQSGSMELCHFLENGECFVAGILKPGDWGGELTHILDDPASYTGIAREPMTVRLLPRAELLDLRAKHPEINAALLDKVAGLLRFYINRFEANTRMSAKNRILWLLNWLQSSHGEPKEDGTIAIKDIQLKDFYRMIGAARQTVSREFHRLIDDGIVQHSREEILILDAERLIEMLKGG